MAVKRVLANLLCTDQPVDVWRSSESALHSRTPLRPHYFRLGGWARTLNSCVRVATCGVFDVPLSREGMLPAESARKEIIDTLKAAIKDKAKPPSVKLKALKALSICIELGSPDLVAYAGRKVLERLTKLALASRDIDNQTRGLQLFAATDSRERLASQDFLKLLLVSLRMWAQKYPESSGSESLYKKAYVKVLSRVAFPPDPREEEEQQKLLQVKREVLHVQRLLESAAPYQELAPLVAQLRPTQVELAQMLQIPSKHIRQLLSLHDLLTAALTHFDELYPQTSPKPAPPRSSCVVPPSFPVLTEPQSLPLPKCDLQFESASPGNPHSLEKVEDFYTVIHQQEEVLARLGRELQEEQRSAAQARQERDEALALLRTCKCGAKRATSPKAGSQRNSLDSSFLLEAEQDGGLTSRSLACEDMETPAPTEAANLSQVQHCFHLSRGVLYSGEVCAAFVWCAPQVLTLCVRCPEELTLLRVESEEVVFVGETQWSSLCAQEEVKTQVRVRATELCSLPLLRLRLQRGAQSLVVPLALPVGPMQTVSRSEVTAEESVALWLELAPFQTLRRFTGLRKELRSMQAVAAAVSFTDTFKCFSSTEVSRLKRSMLLPRKSSLLLCGKAFEKDVLVCVSLNKDASGGVIAVRCAHVRLREALVPCIRCALVA